MKRRLLFASLSVALAIGIGQYAVSQPLEVRGNYFYDEEGLPFFWLGDINYTLIAESSREEAVTYLDTRKSEGFNVVMTSLLHYDGVVDLGNAYGDLPLVDGRITAPDQTVGRKVDDPEAYDYWDHADWLISEARSREMKVALLPIDGELVTPRYGNSLIASAEDAYRYGFWVGRRFANYNTEIIWMLGGDRMPDEAAGGIAIWNAMAEGITDGVRNTDQFDGSAEYEYVLMSYHCYEQPLFWFEEAEWLDFVTWGSTSDRSDPSRAYRMPMLLERADDRLPSLNVVPPVESSVAEAQSESSYTQIDAFDSRRVAYWSVFGGAAGHNYHSDEMNASNAPEGVGQMRHLAALMHSRPFHSAAPYQKVIAANPMDDDGYLVATLGEGYIMVYNPIGKAVTLDRTAISYDSFRSWWYDPRIGIALEAQHTDGDNDLLRFDPPGEVQRGNDWILVIDDVSMPFRAPGTHN